VIADLEGGATRGRWIAAGALEQTDVEDALYVAAWTTGSSVTMAHDRPGRPSAAVSAQACGSPSTWTPTTGWPFGDAVGSEPRGPA
jgi:hypothetical protein